MPALTVVNPAPVSEEPATAVENLSFAPARILVADDHAANRRLLVEYLSPYGFEWIEAEDGAQALGTGTAKQRDRLELAGHDRRIRAQR